MLSSGGTGIEGTMEAFALEERVGTSLSRWMRRGNRRKSWVNLSRGLGILTSFILQISWRWLDVWVYQEFEGWWNDQREAEKMNKRICVNTTGANTTCVHAKMLLSCLTLCNPMDYSPPGSSVHAILQARILKWAAISSSRGFYWPKDRTQVSCGSCIAGGFFTAWVTKEALKKQLIPLQPWQDSNLQHSEVRHLIH